jgi:cytochrome b561
VARLLSVGGFADTVGKMQLTNSKAQYGAVPQILHWLTAVFVICGFLLGQFGDDLPKGNAQDIGLFVHMTL